MGHKNYASCLASCLSSGVESDDLALYRWYCSIIVKYCANLVRIVDIPVALYITKPILNFQCCMQKNPDGLGRSRCHLSDVHVHVVFALV